MLSEGAVSLSRNAWFVDDGHGACNGFTASTVPATGLRAVGASVRPACVSYSSLIKPALRSASLRPTGKLCRQSTCGAGLLRSCEPKRLFARFEPRRLATSIPNNILLYRNLLRSHDCLPRQSLATKANH
jgi:hypothetical protein